MTVTLERSPTVEETRTLGVAVVGCGYWGVNYVRVFDELEGAHLVSVCEPRRERLAQVGARYPEAAAVASLEEALAMDGVDAVVVSTSATSHHEVARRCLLAGKHVLVEKPMTMTAEEASELTRLSEDTGLTLMVGHTFLYNAGIRRIKQYIDEGRVGRLHYVYAQRTNLGPIRNDVNAVWDLAPHDVSVLDYLVGGVPEWVSAVGAKVLANSREDVGFVTLHYPSGVIGNIHISWADPHKVRELVVVGSESRIAFDDTNARERVRVFDKGVCAVTEEAEDGFGVQLQFRDGDILSPNIEASEPLKVMCGHFLECVATGSRPLTDGLAGREVVQVMQAIDGSMAQNGAPVAVEQRARKRGGRRASTVRRSAGATPSHP